MDRIMTADHLAQAEGHVTLGEKHIARQKEIIAELQRGSHDTEMAESLLVQFEELQAIHVADRDRLAKQLAQISN